MKKLIVALGLVLTLAACAQTTSEPTGSTPAAKSKYGIGPTSLPPVITPSV
ncbi:lipoprotein [Rhizobium sp. S95]|uniref:Type IV secretion system putative lipoprotein virB7 n=1 Tax=Ciceribacter sichuanensis TaxID=2949647 RepID=A0AAJ1BUF2_9HYPH|nr:MULTISPECIES: lipoprotein [unclassified Ciceribacter]MCM2399233.1 lipoprotein [Ciceribacter sp. S95]MCM2401809.1 lipoprotein [Ciceribacter sp. S153]MCO5956561.1 lipoprotein [Ciceribacter sp. S101]